MAGHLNRTSFPLVQENRFSVVIDISVIMEELQILHTCPAIVNSSAGPTPRLSAGGWGVAGRVYHRQVIPDASQGRIREVMQPASASKK